MDRNTLLAFALSFLVLSIWMTWEAGNRPPPDTALVTAEATPTPIPTIPTSRPAPGATPTASEFAPPPPLESELIQIETDRFRATLDSRGAGIRHWELSRYTTPSDEGGLPVVLIDRAPDDPVAFASPMMELGLGDLAVAVFRVTERTARSVRFEYASGGLVVGKTYTFQDDSYLFRLALEVQNGTDRTVASGFVISLPDHVRSGTDFKEASLEALVDGEIEKTPINGFGEPGFFSSGSAQQIFTGPVAWAGSGSGYFLTAMVPESPSDAQAQWLKTEPSGSVAVQLGYPPITLPGPSMLSRQYEIYAGPKKPEQLAAAGAQLDRSIDLGWSWIAPLTRGFIWLLSKCYAVIPNYGVAIILLTVLIRLVTAPLASKQMRSMKRLGELQPKIKELQERHKDDRERQSQEMMKLYRESGANPLGGCLPMLLQFPVFIGLYYALQSSFDLRQAPFALWIDDLSRPENLFVLPGFDLPVRLLPLLMGASMVLQQKMTPTTADPAQARMMMTVMPVMFTFLFYQFPSGLVLYWFVSNLLAIAQQFYLNRQKTA